MGNSRVDGTWFLLPLPDAETHRRRPFAYFAQLICHSRIFKSRDRPLLPLAADADENNQDGDHKGGCCRDGSQEQQVLVGIEICPLRPLRIHHTELPSAHLFTFTGAKAQLRAVSAQGNLQRSKEERLGIKLNAEMT